MKLRTLLIILGIILLLGAIAFAYWYFSQPLQVANVPINNGSGGGRGFVPFSGGMSVAGNGGANNSGRQNSNQAATTTMSGKVKLPVLRLLNATPVGGYSASTTASTTVIRWVDRGRGNIYEAREDNLDITTISNTILPRVYESWWNKNMTSFIGQYLDGANDNVTTVISNILKRPAPPVTKNATSSLLASSTANSNNSGVQLTPYELKGNTISGNIISIAKSPKGDKVLEIINENGLSVGYISNFDGSGQKKLFDTPLAQVNADWPEDNTIAITTKGSANYQGYLYFVDVRTGAMKQILGGINGLSAKVSRDASLVVFSATGPNNDIITGLFDVKKQAFSDVAFKTLADKCVWSAKFKNMAYCGVGYKIDSANYPDNWYIGAASFIDGIWSLNATTGETHQVAKLLDLAPTIIDAYNLQLDANDNYLLFMNKNDLSLWSLDLVAAH